MTGPLEAERHARLVLSRVIEPGTVKVHRLVSDVGPVALRDHLANDRHLGEPTEVAARIAEVDPVRTLEQARRLGIRYVVPGDDEWPASVERLDAADPLHDIGGSPLGLWVRGPVRLDELVDSVAVVGSRSATSYGMATAQELAGGIAQDGRIVVSGAAFGIDYAAHRGALAAGGRTVAVLACGADRPYPTAHRELISYIAEHGAVVSEMPPGYAPMRNRFLSRNRVIAALSAGTVVVEAAARSGALNTAGWAGRLMKPLMAMPGPINSGTSRGAHDLIRSGAAVLATCVEDVLEQLSAVGEAYSPVLRGPEAVRDRLNRDQARILEAVPVHRPASADAIARTASLGSTVAKDALAELRELGLVVEDDRGWRLGDRARA
ncbi:DNA-processing protein DprA [Nocardioides alcanivorans]|uniref:DNA-processing protein DprA n=1 Tax=Nocardioides alcanivorans TaxID=2897352 RepID=UPI001F1E4EB8|nr:DNA-processing protein DprA [Nocardioides alcanivorans]